MIFRLRPDVFGIRTLLLVIMVLPGNFCLAQRENVWNFGNSASVDFNNLPPSSAYSALDVREGNAGICDQNGDLLFYTDGSVVYDRNHSLMPNGVNLTGMGLGVTASTVQGTVIVPFPGDGSKFYVFSLGASEYAANGRLYYSVVDLTLNSGMGDVITNQKGILLDTGLTEQLTTAPASQNCGVWILAVSKSDFTLKSYLVSAGGISSNPVISPGIPSGAQTTEGVISSLAVSPQGDKLASTYNGVTLFDFDAVTGLASNPIYLSTNRRYMSCFSPDGSKLYVSGSSVVQYDLSSGDPLIMATSAFGVGDGWGLKLGPDGVLYVSREDEPTLDAILQPNLPGVACQYEAAYLQLAAGSYARLGLPNVVSVALPDTHYSVQTIEPGCFESSGVVTANDIYGWSYEWDNGDTMDSRIVMGEGTYWVRYHTVCSFNVDTFHLRLPNGVLPAIHAEPACRDDADGHVYAATYPGDPVNYRYAWLRGNDTLSISDTLSNVPAGSYSLYVSTDTGCDTLLTFTIPEEDFRVSFMVSDTISCLGDALQFQNTSDTHFTAFYWGLGNGESYSLPELQDYRYPEPGAYRVLLAGEGAICKDTAYQTIVVDQPIVPSFEFSPGEVCVGQPVHFRPYTDSTTTQLQWTLAGQARLEASIENQYQHAFDWSGVFPVTLGIQSRACPDTSFTDSITVYPYPDVDLGGDSSICLHGAPVYLKNLRDAPLSPYHQVWSTGDTTEGLKVVHPGIYTLSVTAEPIGCTTTESIEISKDCYIDIPNAFTPNGDGNNDYFFPRQLLSESVNRFHMQVFNRWGQIVFETNRLDGRGWDGSFNNKVQPTGVYLYRISVDFVNGRQEQYEGNVTLVR